MKRRRSESVGESSGEDGDKSSVLTSSSSSSSSSSEDETSAVPSSVPSRVSSCSRPSSSSSSDGSSSSSSSSSGADTEEPAHDSSDEDNHRQRRRRRLEQQQAGISSNTAAQSTTTARRKQLRTSPNLKSASPKGGPGSTGKVSSGPSQLPSPKQQAQQLPPKQLFVASEAVATTTEHPPQHELPNTRPPNTAPPKQPSPRLGPCSVSSSGAVAAPPPPPRATSSTAPVSASAAPAAAGGSMRIPSMQLRGPPPGQQQQPPSGEGGTNVLHETTAQIQRAIHVLASTSMADFSSKEILEWLRGAEAHIKASRSADLRLQYVAVLGSFPWERFPALSTPGLSSTNIKRFTKIVNAFERVAVALVNSSVQLVTPTIEVVLRPFRTPCDGGFDTLIPVEAIVRIINCVGVAHPPKVAGAIVQQCLEPMFPPRRWPRRDHHEAYIRVLLTLALDAKLDSGASSEKLPSFTAPASGEESEAGRAALGARTATTVPMSSLMSSVAQGAATRSNPYGSSTNVSGVSTADEVSMSDLAGATGGATGLAGVSLSGTNRMMTFRRDFVRIILRHLLDMELTLEKSPDNMKVLKEENPYKSVLKASVRAVFQRLREDMEKHSMLAELGNPQVSPDWWPVVLSVHVDLAVQVEAPVFLHYLAPTLALSGAASEVTTLLHRVISSVTKGSVDNLQGKRAGIGKAANRQLTTEQRIRAAHHAAPLFSFFTIQDCLDVSSTAQITMESLRRLLKWVGGEARNAGSSSTPSALVKIAFAQGVGICNVTGHALEAASDIPSHYLQSLLPLDANQGGAGKELAASSSSFGTSASADATQVADLCKRFEHEGKLRVGSLYRNNLLLQKHPKGSPTDVAPPGGRSFSESKAY